MTRSFMLLLVLIIVFLAGMLFGFEKNGSTLTSQTTEHESQEQDSSKTEQETEETNGDNSDDEEQSKQTEKSIDTSGNEKQHFTQKTALFLEKGVKKFYSLIVDMMYQLANAFF